MTTSFDSDLSPDAIDTISVEHVTRDDDTRDPGGEGGHVAVTRVGSNLSLGSDTSPGLASGRKLSHGKKMSVTSTLSSSSDKILFNMTSGYNSREIVPDIRPCDQ